MINDVPKYTRMHHFKARDHKFSWGGHAWFGRCASLAVLGNIQLTWLDLGPPLQKFLDPPLNCVRMGVAY